MEDPVFKVKYQKCKYKVKVWEKVFKQKNGRVPSKVTLHSRLKFAQLVAKLIFRTHSMTSKMHQLAFVMLTRCTTN